MGIGYSCVGWVLRTERNHGLNRFVETVQQLHLFLRLWDLLLRKLATVVKT